MTPLLEPGQLIGARYRLQRRVGRGGMGEVWQAEHTLTFKAVALKFVRPERQTANLGKRLLREARAASAINHPNVVAVHDVLDLGGSQFALVMDLLQGEDLRAYLNRHTVLSLPATAQLMLPVLSALRCAHAAGVVHRDLKPENVFLSQVADGKVEPKVLDFGVAKLLPQRGVLKQSAELTQTGSLLGTPRYMSPEQICGEKDIDSRTDVWALGLILFECLSGRMPIDGDNLGQVFKAITLSPLPSLAQLAPQLPKVITGAVAQMLERQKRIRLTNLAELERLLEPYAANASPIVVPSQHGELASAASQSAVAGEGVFDDTVLLSSASGGSTLASQVAAAASNTSPSARRSGAAVLAAFAAATLLGLGVWWLSSGASGPSVTQAPAVASAALETGAPVVVPASGAQEHGSSPASPAVSSTRPSRGERSVLPPPKASTLRSSKPKASPASSVLSASSGAKGNTASRAKRLSPPVSTQPPELEAVPVTAKPTGSASPAPRLPGHVIADPPF